MKKKTIATCGIIIIGILSLLYYSAKFYVDKKLVFEDNPFILWFALFSLILCSLVLGVINVYKTDKLEKQNEILIQSVEKLSQDATDNFYNTLQSIYNSRDINIDVYEMCRKILEGAEDNGELD